MLFRPETFRQRRIHFIGIGGIGMSGIAEILLNLGYTVTGSDIRESPVLERLRRMGGTVFVGHAGHQLPDAEAVVTSSAIPGNNPELSEARRRRLPVIARGELLAELMRVKYGIAVSGSHGKTSTASMCAAILAAGGLDPTVVIGGRVASLGSNARLGNSDYLLVEADESDGSFLALDPIVGIVTNIDREHMDHYGSTEALLAAFEVFCNNVPFYGATVVCADDPWARYVAERMRRRCITYGLASVSPQAEFVADSIDSAGGELSFGLSRGGQSMGRFRVQGVGEHTVRNAAAAIAVGTELGIAVDRIRSGLAEFRGVDRRFQTRGVEGGVTVIDDYGHHPTEIRATLSAAAACGFRRVNVIFQPHRYSRTNDLAAEFAGCFSQCDRLWVVDIYSAGERPIPGVSSPALVERILRAGHPWVDYCASMDAAVQRAASTVGTGEAVITLGAGNVWTAGEELLRRLKSDNRGHTSREGLAAADREGGSG
ncbi:MAG: UDP-N-acetylmuramate--L-alanine ligase [Bryobacterales bacterium]|nr:UDP-N-acetylmuramate--L-alanine ligase [Bryobacterales bacterium]